MSNERVLAIGAHCDDTEFGMLGTLLWHKQCGDKFAFLAFTEARLTVWGWQKMTKHFNREYEHFVHLIDQRLDTFALQDIAKHIEDAIEEFKPTIVYCPFIADLNKDHRIISEATMVACRPYLPNAPKQVWMYRIPGSTELGLRPFVNCRDQKIDREKKIELIKEWYPDEIKNGREAIYTETVEQFEAWPRI